MELLRQNVETLRFDTLIFAFWSRSSFPVPIDCWVLWPLPCSGLLHCHGDMCPSWTDPQLPEVQVAICRVVPADANYWICLWLVEVLARPESQPTAPPKGPTPEGRAAALLSFLELLTHGGLETVICCLRRAWKLTVCVGRGRCNSLFRVVFSSHFMYTPL